MTRFVVNRCCVNYYCVNHWRVKPFFFSHFLAHFVTHFFFCVCLFNHSVKFHTVFVVKPLCETSCVNPNPFCSNLFSCFFFFVCVCFRRGPRVTPWSQSRRWLPARPGHRSCTTPSRCLGGFEETLWATSPGPWLWERRWGVPQAFKKLGVHLFLSRLKKLGMNHFQLDLRNWE